MNKLIFAIAGVALLALVPASVAIDPTGDCNSNNAAAAAVPYGAADGQTNVIVPAPAAAFVTNWTPDCITVNNGATVTWTNGDAEALHGPMFGTVTGTTTSKALLSDCWSGGGALSVPGVDTDKVSITVDTAAQTITYHVVSQRAATAAGADVSNAPTSLVQKEVTKTCGFSQKQSAPVTIAGNIATVTYMCLLHGSAMTGHIHVKLG